MNVSTEGNVFCVKGTKWRGGLCALGVELLLAQILLIIIAVALVIIPVV